MVELNYHPNKSNSLEQKTSSHTIIAEKEEQKTYMIINGDQAFIEYMYLNHVFDITKKIKNKDQSLQDFRLISEQYINKYEIDRENQLKSLDLLLISAENQILDSILWYTKDSFVHRMINRILRQGNYVEIFKIRYFINELRQKIQILSQIESDIKILYRGSQILDKELSLLINNMDKPILLNGFVSTSKIEDVALNFILNKRVDCQSVLFKFNFYEKDIKYCASINQSGNKTYRLNIKTKEKLNPKDNSYSYNFSRRS